MAGGEQIAEFFGTLGFRIDQKDITTFNNTLNKLEDRARQFANGPLSDVKVRVNGAEFTAQFKKQLKDGVNRQIEIASNSAKSPELKPFKLKTGFGKELKTLLDRQVDIAGNRTKALSLSKVKLDPAFRKKLKSELDDRVETTSSKGLKIPINEFNIAKDFSKRLHVALNKRVEAASKPAFKPEISSFKFSEGWNTRLYQALQGRMQAVSRNRGFIPEIKIDRFDVDREALLRQVRDAVRYVENNVRVDLRSGVQQPQGPQVGGGARPISSGFGAGAGAAAGASLGGKASVFARGIMPGLGAGWAVSQLNRINQEMMGIEYASTAIFGGEQEGREGMDWLKRFSQEAGLHYRAQAPAYQRMVASADAVGMSQEETQGIFAGVSRYGRTMGLDSQAMQGSMRA